MVLPDQMGPQFGKKITQVHIERKSPPELAG
jgi:hypothetical protein